MAKNLVDQKLRVEAERKFPGDRKQQDAYIAVMTPASMSKPAKPRASTTKKKIARKVAPAAKRRRRI